MTVADITAEVKVLTNQNDFGLYDMAGNVAELGGGGVFFFGGGAKMFTDP